ncbi:ribonuclease H-like domain-containing protein [Dysgonomonas sp. Marseille-P4677]|uniref:ribonuclease H-like domain-containing protein n=1 Tax=Dysgonomonas sp. Marseille-P4677 TaxID=2364790 RepID=UPI001913F7FB|nr:ribonuclease H-like domain-containing protein [Dysgonomonas sp. Marseille-P4677]MBK5722565.1 ribonuclease H-like domain-containing protein [Dysgonomonas sp. Marseille-P4677]
MINNLQSLKDEIISLWDSGKFDTKAGLAKYIIDKYTNFDRPDDSIRRSISKIISKHKRKQAKKPERYIPKILFFDIETAPMRAFVWGHWKNNIALSQVISNTFVLCWSAKWIGSDKVISDVLTPEESLVENDKRITENLWKLFDEAEIIVGHNIEKFDIPRMNSRFVIHGLPRPSTYRTIDTLRAVRRYCGFASNRLDALAGYFNLEHKLTTDFDLWAKSMSGDKDSLEYMSKYCDRDVLLLEEVYNILRPWISNHPNVGLYFDLNKGVCAVCGSTDLKEEKPYYTTVGRYQTYRCNCCGALSKVKRSDYDNSKLLRSI